MSRDTFIMMFPWLALGVSIALAVRLALAEKGNASVFAFAVGLGAFPILWWSKMGSWIAPYIFMR